MLPRRATSWLVGLALAATPLAALAQRGGGVFGSGGQRYENVPYNGRFTFSRVRFGGGFGRGGGSWSHDYPQADLHLPRILDALTSLNPNLDRSNIFDLEDTEIFRQPVLYLWEPGFWRITDQGAVNLRQYMLKGGFIIFDDFEADQWWNFEAQFRRVLPDAEFIELTAAHPLFHSFFELNEINVPHPSVRVVPAYYGVFENNDPASRMMALVNYNNDIAEYWEWSGQGVFPVDLTNDAYKLGVNYMIYALTH